ncbi:MAG: hypothetical protein MH321_12845 [Leptospiraceae bacterium]|nr:hypothetical protein [Leptospiraceae bacterium]
MKYIFLSFLFFIALTFCGDKPSSLQEPNSSEDSLPIEIQKLQEGNKIILQLNARSGFGIQIDVPNVISASAKDGLVIESQNLVFAGSPNLKKPEYYLNLKPMELTFQGKGKLILQGKIFYCDFSKNICLPGKIYRELNI